MKFNRVFLIVLDSLGVGEASDALKYDDVVRKQRETFYKERQEVVKAEHLNELLKKLMYSAIDNKVEEYITTTEKKNYNSHIKNIFKNIN